MKPTTDEQYIDALIAYRVTSYAEAWENNEKLKNLLLRRDFGKNRNYGRVLNKIEDNRKALKKYAESERLSRLRFMDKKEFHWGALCVTLAVVFLIILITEIFFYFLLK